MALFQKSVLNKHLNNLDIQQVANAYEKFTSNYTANKIEQIKTLKEEEYQDGFLRDIFVDVFGYVLRPEENYNLQREFKNQSDGKKADGAILKDDKALAVIELKSTKTKDLTKVTQQAFNYKNNQPDCKYVITSNFQKLRFYIDYAHEYEEFDLFNLQKDEFKLLYLILHKDNLLADLPLQIKKETKFHEQEISSKLYKDYSHFKTKLFENLVKNQPELDQLVLFKKSQKLLDRFLFILFAEDSGLLPPNSISRIVKRFEVLKREDAYKPIYQIYQQYFNYMNTGRKGHTPDGDIPAYNGGLFYPDALLDKLTIDDEALIDDLLNLSAYDFNTEVDVNILGHIFEHSLSEIEEITAQIEGTVADKKKSKRKKDGVFYTPKYITQYIVDNTVGTLCNEKRIELDIEEIEFDGTYRKKGGGLKKEGEKLYKTLNDYKDWLLTLKILDPACGSGAFLNQALNFLIAEHKNIDDILAELTNTTLPIFDTDKSILENNLFGVDINEESVEIAQLSLWLRTAKKGRKLSSLNDNIKCGNSLIDDPEIAGDKAFDWNIEFKDIMDNGGFDVVIGNPPYVKRQNLSDDNQIQYLESSYKSATYNFDLYLLFIEKGSKLIKNNGLLSYITPSKFTSTKTGTGLRKFLDSNCNIIKYIDFEDYQIFLDATTYCCIFILANRNKGETIYLELNKKIPYDIYSFKSTVITIKESASGIGWQFKPTVAINGNKRIKDFVNIFTGIETGADYIYILEQKDIDNYDLGTYINEIIYPLLKGTNAKRYFHEDVKYYGIVPYNNKRELISSNIISTKYPNLWQYFLLNKEHLISRDKGRMNTEKWYGFVYPKNLHKYNQDRIIWSDISIRPKYSIDKNNIWHIRTICSMELKGEVSINNISLELLLALFNSTLFFYFIKNNSNSVRGGYLRYRPQYVKEFPIQDKISDESNKKLEKFVKEQMVKSKKSYYKANKFINRTKDTFELEKISKKLKSFYDFDFKTFVAELKKQKAALSLTQQDEWEDYFNTYKTEINQLQTQITQTDQLIDQMVYKLYGLTDEEIAIVEES